jgi:hypothetical protein
VEKRREEKRREDERRQSRPDHGSLGRGWVIDGGNRQKTDRRRQKGDELAREG